MPAPVFDQRTSVLVAVLDREFAFQPGLVESSDPATGFTCDGLPAGMFCDAVTGKITGAPEEVGVFVIQLTASNASGSTALNFVLGVEDRTFQIPDSEAIEINIDLRTGHVTAPGTTPGEPWQAQPGRPEMPGSILGAKFADKKLLAIGFTKDGILQELDCEWIAIALKEIEPEQILVESDGVVEKIGAGESTRFLILLDLDSSALGAALAEYETDYFEAGFPFLTEISYLPKSARPGDVEPVPRENTSKGFRFAVYRDWIKPPASSSSSAPASSSSSSAPPSSSGSSAPPSSGSGGSGSSSSGSGSGSGSSASTISSSSSLGSSGA